MGVSFGGHCSAPTTLLCGPIIIAAVISTIPITSTGSSAGGVSAPRGRVCRLCSKGRSGRSSEQLLLASPSPLVFALLPPGGWAVWGTLQGPGIPFLSKSSPWVGRGRGPSVLRPHKSLLNPQGLTVPDSAISAAGGLGRGQGDSRVTRGVDWFVCCSLPILVSHPASRVGRTSPTMPTLGRALCCTEHRLLLPAPVGR